MDNEKELTQQETAPKPKKNTKKKPTKQETEQPQPLQEEPTKTDATEQTTSTTENPTWDFYNQTQSVETKQSHGGSKHTPSVRRNAQKRIRKAKTQRASRRINRRK